MQDASEIRAGRETGTPSRPAAAAHDRPGAPLRGGTAQSGLELGLGVLPRPISIIELAVILAGILAIDWMFPSLDVHDLQPSPYWLPVLLISAQYGTVSGAIAVGAAIALHVAFATFPEQGVGENDFAYRLRTLSQPILWIAAALMLGQFRMMQIAAKRELSRKVLELDAQRQTLADYAGRLRQRCEALEREIAGRPLDATRHYLWAAGVLESFVATPPEAAARDKAPAASSYRLRAGAETDKAVTAVLAAAYPGASLSLFLRSGDGFALAATSGADFGTLFLDRLSSAHPLSRAMLSVTDGLRILNPEDEQPLGSQGLAAVPVFSRADRAVVGMVKLEQGSSRLVSEQILTELSAIARVLEPMIEPDAGPSGDGSRGEAADGSRPH